MLTEKQVENILIDVKRNVGEWVGETLSFGRPPIHFKGLHDLLVSANVDLAGLFDLEPLTVLEKTLEACKTLGLEEREFVFSLDSWSADASKLFNLKQEYYPEFIR